MIKAQTGDMIMNTEKRKLTTDLVLGTLGAFAGILIVVLINNFVLRILPLPVKAPLVMIEYWLIAVIPIIIIIRNKEKLCDYGFTKEHIGKQLIIGIALGLCMSAVFTLLPRLLGYGEYFSSNKVYRYLWQYIYEIIYCIISVAAVEEFVFRGFIYEKAKALFSSEGAAIAVSSVLFGLFHIFNGDIGQVIITAVLGALWCFFRLKIKGCTIISLIIMHGVYDFLIVLITNVSMK